MARTPEHARHLPASPEPNKASDTFKPPPDQGPAVSVNIPPPSSVDSGPWRKHYLTPDC